MIVINKQILTSISQNLVQKIPNLKHSFAIDLTARALGWNSLHAATADLKIKPLVLNTTARYKNQAWTRLYPNFLGGTLKQSIALHIKQIMLFLNLKECYLTDKIIDQLLIKAVTALGSIQINSSSEKFDLSFKNKRIETYYRSPYKDTWGTRTRFLEEMQISAFHFLTEKGFEYTDAWSLVAGWISVFKSTIESAILKPNHLLLDRMENYAIETEKLAQKMVNYHHEIKDKMIIGELLNLVITTDLCKRNSFLVPLNNRLKEVYPQALELYSNPASGNQFALDDWYNGIIDRKPKFKPLPTLSKGNYTEKQAESIIANTNTRIFMRATDMLPSNLNEHLQSINSNVLKTMFEPKQATSVIACTNTKIFMRTEESANREISSLIPIKSGTSSSARIILEFT